MANFDSLFSVGIGADISILQAELQKAKNLLTQFESAARKATNIGELNYLNSQIGNLKNTIGTLGNEMSKTGKPIGDASQSLVNFSRIAQDAPYGIQGVANNLNPMVESFQRLAATEGGTKKALQAMIAGLSGPAGIGVAIGVVSSLAVTFSKQISEFFNGPTEDLKKFREELKKVADDIYKILGQEQSKRTKGILLSELIVGGTPTQQAEALKQLKDLYKDNAAIQNAKLGEDRKFYDNLVNLALLQGAAVDKEKNNLNQLDLLYAKQIENNKKRNSELQSITGVVQGKTLKDFNKVISVDEQKAAINKHYDDLNALVKKDITTLELLTRTELGKVTMTPTVDKGGVKDKISEIQKALNSLKADMNSAEFKLLNNLINEKGAKDSYAVVVLESIYKTIDKIAGSKSKEALDTVKKLLGTAADLEEKYYGKQPTAPKSSLTTEGVFKAEPDLTKGTGEKQLDSLRTARQLAMFNREQIAINFAATQKTAAFTEKTLEEQKKVYEDFALSVSRDVVGALDSMYQAMQNGDSFGKAFGDMLGKIVEQLIMVVAQAAIFALIMESFGMPVGGGGGGGFMSIFKSLLGVPEHAAGGITTGPSLGIIGEAGPEAIMPLSKLGNFLNTSFNAGAMSGGHSGNGGTFTLRGQDLLVAINRTQKSSGLKGQNISLI